MNDPQKALQLHQMRKGCELQVPLHGQLKHYKDPALTLPVPRGKLAGPSGQGANRDDEAQRNKKEE